MHPSVPAMWRAYLATLGETPETTARPLSTWHFCDNQADADALVELVLRGRKRATAASVAFYESRHEPRPRPGDAHVVTDWAGVARCVVRTTSVEVVPFEEVSAAHAAAEGEGDLSLDYWRRVHHDYYLRELEGTGVSFDERLPVVCEGLELVYPPAAAEDVRIERYQAFSG